MPIQQCMPTSGPRSRGAPEPPSASPRSTDLGSLECDLWLGARDPEARRHHWTGQRTTVGWCRVPGPAPPSLSRADAAAGTGNTRQAHSRATSRSGRGPGVVAIRTRIPLPRSAALSRIPARSRCQRDVTTTSSFAPSSRAAAATFRALSTVERASVSQTRTTSALPTPAHQLGLSREDHRRGRRRQRLCVGEPMGADRVEVAVSALE